MVYCVESYGDVSFYGDSNFDDFSYGYKNRRSRIMTVMHILLALLVSSSAATVTTAGSTVFLRAHLLSPGTGGYTTYVFCVTTVGVIVGSIVVYGSSYGIISPGIDAEEYAYPTYATGEVNYNALNFGEGRVYDHSYGSKFAVHG